MTPSTPKPRRSAVSPDTTEAVDQFLAKLKHPHMDAVETLRRLINSADPSIDEGVKWNAPSFRTTEYFATINLREQESIGVILHVGAKARANVTFQVEDSHGLLKWLAKDRALMTFAGVEDVKAHASALQAIVRAWILSV
ncbi:MAG: DUF1801 domain-containing protein [Legionella sp.]|nr:DUF1801 domain-containing protein [Legionella sp.]